MPKTDRHGHLVHKTPWAWLRGFGWFLLAWPLLATMGLDELTDADWPTILIAMFGPALIGLILLGVEWLLTRGLGHRVGKMARHRPSTYRDISNTALTYVTLMLLGVGLGAFDDAPLFVSAAAAWACARVIGVGAGVAVAFRVIHRWRRGPAEHFDLGKNWDARPQMMNWMGYLLLIPMLLVSMVMVADAVDTAGKGQDAVSEFGWVAWFVLPCVLWLAQRSAMATSLRYRAGTPWEVMLRAQSLAAPWWLVVGIIGLGFTVITAMFPFNIDGSLSPTGQVLAGVFLTPLGLITAALVLIPLKRLLPGWLSRLRVNRTLAQRPASLASWRVDPPPESIGDAQAPGMPMIRLSTRSGLRAAYPLRDGTYGQALHQWLKKHHASAGDEPQQRRGLSTAASPANTRP